MQTHCNRDVGVNDPNGVALCSHGFHGQSLFVTQVLSLGSGSSVLCSLGARSVVLCGFHVALMER